ncbi:MAG: glycoside hydrolase family 3 N-terminal domain-containing protein [Prolixibacteraceae bacterium]
MKRPILILFILLTGLAAAFSQTKRSYPYQNPKLPTEQRVKDLLGRMSLHEKILQLQHLQGVPGTGYQDGNSYGCVVNTGLSAGHAATAYGKLQKYMQDSTRWGIPVLTCTEALHGAVQGDCTIYPQAIALGSTFNPELVRRMAEFISLDLKAMHIKQILSPDLDIARELRWGRVEETYGEDPYLNAVMGIAYVKTFQKNGIICTPKHFVAHGSPTSGLNLASVSGGEREFRSIYLYPFEKVIREANPMSLMNCYSSYDGVPIAGSHYYLTDLLRKELGFNGYVYSDWGSIDMLYNFHHTASDNADAARQALEAGIDMEATGNLYLELEKLVQEKKMDINDIDQAVSRVLQVKFASGLFDKPVSEAVDETTIIHSKESVSLAREIAAESIILLKNDYNLLPLSAGKQKSIALIGPNADRYQPGDYSWTRSNEHGVTLLQGLKNLAGNQVNIHYAKGCDGWSQSREGFTEAVAAARNSDLAVVVVGTESGTFSDNASVTCGEGFDLNDIGLPGVQEDLIKEIKAVGKPVIVVLLAGKPLAMPWVKDNADAVLVQWYGGEEQGNAMADVLFGNVNPSGRLNVSFPQSTGHLPCYYNYLPTDKGYYHVPGSTDKPGRDYVFSSPASLWSFGYGLSYTTFDYVNAVVDKREVSAGDTVSIDVTVKNTGNRDGQEVVQLYVRDVVSSVVTPVKQLKAFSKVHLKAGEAKTAHLSVPVDELALYNKEMKRVVEPGEFELQIGASSDHIKIVKKINVTE